MIKKPRIILLSKGAGSKTAIWLRCDAREEVQLAHFLAVNMTGATWPLRR